MTLSPYILELFFYKLNPEMEQESHADAIDPDDPRLMDHYPTYDADFDDWPTTNADLTTNCSFGTDCVYLRLMWKKMFDDLWSYYM
jgi:hypothetical protein